MVTDKVINLNGEEYKVYMSTLTGKEYIYVYDGPAEQNTGRYPLELDKLNKETK